MDSLLSCLEPTEGENVSWISSIATNQPVILSWLVGNPE